MIKQFYFKQFSLASVNKVKWFQVLRITNNPIKHQSFVYTYSTDETVLFQTIYFSIGHLFELRLNVLFDPYIGSFQVPQIRTRGDLGAMAIKGYSAFLKAPALLEFHRQIV